MRFALIADVHGNLAALRAVLADVARRAPDARLVCAGDVVGYGPDPDACIELLAAHGAVTVAGNHEAMILGRSDFARAGSAAIAAALWSREHLSGPGAAWIARLPNRTNAGESVIVCHGDLNDTESYVTTPRQAAAVVDHLEHEYGSGCVLVCGHTHHPMLFATGAGVLYPKRLADIGISRSGSTLINPGSVGQERVEEQPWARYAILDLDDEIVSYRAIEYDHEATVRRARAVGLRPTIVLLPPRGIVARRVERAKTRWARRRAKNGRRVEA